MSSASKGNTGHSCRKTQEIIAVVEALLIIFRTFAANFQLIRL